MLCIKCGKQLPDDASFCTECGTELKKAEQGASVPQPAAKEGVFNSSTSQENCGDPWRRKAESLLNSQMKDPQTAAEIYDALYQAKILQFSENPLSEKAIIRYCTIPITQNGFTSRWLSVFTTTESMRLIQDNTFLVEGQLFPQIVQELLSNPSLSGIIVNPKLHNFLFPRDFVINLEEGRKLIADNKPKLNKLAELISSPSRDEVVVRDEIADLLNEARLPIMMIKGPDGKLYPAECRVNKNGKTLIAFFTSEERLHDTARAIGFTGYRVMFQRKGVLSLIKRGIDWKLQQPVIDPVGGSCYLIDKNLCEKIQEIENK